MKVSSAVLLPRKQSAYKNNTSLKPDIYIFQVNLLPRWQRRCEASGHHGLFGHSPAVRNRQGKISTPLRVELRLTL